MGIGFLFLNLQELSAAQIFDFAFTVSKSSPMEQFLQKNIKIENISEVFISLIMFWRKLKIFFERFRFFFLSLTFFLFYFIYQDHPESFVNKFPKVSWLLCVCESDNFPLKTSLCIE